MAHRFSLSPSFSLSPARRCRTWHTCPASATACRAPAKPEDLLATGHGRPSARWATRIKEKFDGATSGGAAQGGHRQGPGADATPSSSRTPDEDLVYLDAQPGLLRARPAHAPASLGTVGRQCNKHLQGHRRLRAHVLRPRLRPVRRRCRWWTAASCKFHWCCYVKCKRCTKTVDQFVCK